MSNEAVILSGRVEEAPVYNPEFVAEMMESKKQIDEGRVVIKTIEELRAMEK